MLRIDLNCDLGESFGIYSLGRDAEMMDYVSSVNIACGFHAGDPSVMKKTVRLAKEKGVSIGAHPGYPDLQGFGRRNMQCSPEEVADMVLYQVGALRGFTDALGIKLSHVKPHGALYNQAAIDPILANAIAEAVRSIDKNLVLFGLSQSHLITEAEKVGLKTAAEVFADRSYQPDGKLTARNQANALIEEEEKVLQQALQMILKGKVVCVNGAEIPIQAQTLCIHGDGKKALEFAQTLFEGLKRNGIKIQAPYV